MGITFGITVCNELKEFESLLINIKSQISDEDEIIVLCDIMQGHTYAVRDICEKHFTSSVPVFISNRLDNDFATFKNNLVKFATKDYILQIDADELMCDNFVPNLRQILELNPNIDCYTVVRENYVTGITDEYIKEQGWYKDTQSRINFPDRQYRLFKNNDKIFWKNKVHEVLDGWRIVANLPEAMTLIHTKTFDKQVSQNEFYAKNFTV